MNLSTGQIIKNLLTDEPVRVTKIAPLGSMTSIHYVGINSNVSNNKLLTKDQLEKLEIISEDGTFNFTGNPEKFKLFAEAERINSAYQFDPLFAVNCSVIDPLPHQVEAVYKYLLPLPNIRFLLADDTGAGKTIMTGLLIKELMMRDLVKRILIVTPGGLTKQWQEDELGLKFNLPFKLVNRATFNADPNIFSSNDKLVTSIDFIRSEDVLNVLGEVSWDIVVVDEAHKLSAFDYGHKRYRSKRYQALEKISTKSEHLLLLTATPHRGRADTFKNLLQLLDEDIFASESLVTSRINEINESGINKFFIRRLKEQMKDWSEQPLFKERSTNTIMYKLTEEEKRLYDRVTNYLMKRREEAQQQSNIHVSLALMVMQRRLTSSIFAIYRTLKNRYDALNGLLQELTDNPSLWKQRQKFDLEVTNIDDYDDLDDDEKDGLENILSDPKKFKLFTTAKSPSELRDEKEQVKQLFDFAEHLYNSRQEEAKFHRLKRLLKEKGVFDNKDEKLVIFTEHKDTLMYLTDRLSNNGYTVETIHGGKSVDERRQAQAAFARESQILIATDAAGEGINLQFCRLLINWDIPWNPNRLEQRMGRIHRYGQKQDVLVFNMVAQNTREGNVLQRLLTKLDLIREQIGNDRVYDVISDVFEEVAMEDIINSTFNRKETKFDVTIDASLTKENVEKKIKEQKEKMAHSDVDYEKAKELKEKSDERRLQPIYIQQFFEKAYTFMGGELEKVNSSVYHIVTIPDAIVHVLREDYNISADLTEYQLCFDKQVFLDFQFNNLGAKMFYVNPGNPIFDALLKVVRNQYREEMMKGTILVSPEDTDSHLAFVVKSQITDNRPSKGHENVADETIHLVCYDHNNELSGTSPAKLIDLKPPSDFAKKIDTPEPVQEELINEWCFTNITAPQFEVVQKRIKEDISQRKLYLDEAFNNIIFDVTNDINELQRKILLGDNKVNDKIQKKQAKIQDLMVRKEQRHKKLEAMTQLSPKEPEIMGCAYVVPLNQIEYQKHYGMKRDDEVEKIAMDYAAAYERSNGWTPEDVSSLNLGYDIRSTSPEHIKKYIEVKGRATIGGIMLSENEMFRLGQLGDSAWLYIVYNCKSKPELVRIQNPAKNLQYEKLSKGVQYFLSEKEWKNYN
ncbi:helicase-related protein [Draconibacterium sp. IB214405]|uniref:helicase-related protein n=1 Tax=Draconibacterium sp. IB214405 TaxID=3097352 RepID=UPI002A166033|nr:helicase-related protein [Draconibacterium sp. IB214405]MDX8340547.1 helicase-related protein [Draconibacterium sp. IB214405]